MALVEDRECDCSQGTKHNICSIIQYLVRVELKLSYRVANTYSKFKACREQLNPVNVNAYYGSNIELPSSLGK